MTWLKTLIRFWKGELIEEEKRRSQEEVDEARNVIAESRAMLNGEANWLRPIQRKSCDGER